MAQKILVGTDKYGTKTYDVLVTCDRCGGRGEYWWGAIINGSPQYAGVCFKCNGAGKVWEKEKEYTPERRAQLNAQNAKRAEKRAEQQEALRQQEYETNKLQSLSREGFSAEGETWVFLGETYSIKDTLKGMGARFSRDLGWHIDHPVDGYETIQIALEQVAEITQWGRVEYKSTAKKVVDTLKAKATPASDAPASEWVGTEKERMTLDLTLVREVSIDTMYGEMRIYTFHAGSDVLVWKTSSRLWADPKEQTEVVEEGQTIKAKATIKAHSEYRGIKQTELTRLAVVA